MSLGPHRTPYGFSAMSSTSNSLPRQHVMNAPTFQQVMTIVPAPNPPTLPTHHNSNNSNNNNNNNNNSNNNNNNGTANNNASITRHATAGTTPQNLYCDNCQTFRHVAFFQEKEYKYKVCKMCSERELQKRLYNKERYEQYEEQQKNLKHNRYSIHQHQQRQQQTYSVQTATSVYAQQAQISPHYANNNNTAANPTPAPSTSSQIPIQLPQMPIGLGGGNGSANLPPPPNLATPTNSNNASPQISTPSSSMMLGINMKGNSSSNKQHAFPTVAILPNSNNTSTTNNNNSSNNGRHDQQQLHMHQVIQPSLPLPNPSIATQRNRTSNRAASNASIATNVNLISLDEFVEELKRHIDFDRKLYHIDIQSLIESMGPSAGFTQLGRKICEKVLEGTKFNFRYTYIDN
ncbi:hypothetical protein BCV72DRAFT_324242 [Rhizopus microsporus var. microsporus]|uniref:Uncharacterized protein n=1 Tax=Rhizopus microsporus var. microsporus TaxID=86635 RepID=A0A1X0R839_RHIZD|nr:hypothetical protein BCV72DRAFT_324242 [Rhizopus microsporus var. microsporus]